MKIDLRECKKGDILISSLGGKLRYIRPTYPHEYLDHFVEYLDIPENPHLNGGFGTRTDDGHVFRFKRIPETDHDIVKIIKNSDHETKD